MGSVTMVEYANRQRSAAWVLVIGGVAMGIILQLAGRIHLAPLLLGVVCMAAHFTQRPDDRYLEPGGLLFGFGLGTFVLHEGWLTGLVGEGAEIAGLGIGMLIVHSSRSSQAGRHSVDSRCCTSDSTPCCWALRCCPRG